MLYSSTKKKIQEIQKEVDLITDRLGHPIDEQIKPAVIALRLSGFPTSASCQGHEDWGLPYPWVDIDCQLWDTDEFRSISEVSNLGENPIWLKYQDIGKQENDKHLDKFQDILNVYNSSPHVDCRDINIEYYGGFGAFRIRASSLEKMNRFADFLVRRYDFCSSPELRPTPIYMEEKHYQEFLEWIKESNE